MSEHTQPSATETRTEPGPALRRYKRAYKRRRVLFTDRAGSAGAALEAAAEGRYEAVYLVGDDLRTVEPIRRFRRGGLPAGWRPAPRGHFEKAPAPAYHFEGPGGRRVAIFRAAAYFGEGSYSAEEAAAAWARLERLLAVAFDDGRLLATPSTTGRYLLARSIAYGREWPTLSAGAQELIRSTSGQGRIEFLGSELVRGDLFELDARLAYAACARELGAGEPVHDAIGEYAGQRRGRYRVEATVPSDWRERCACGAPGHAGIGVLPFAESSGAWSYPSEPGRRFVTWVDGAELHVAIRHGWPVRVLERLLFPWPPYPDAVNPYNNRRNLRGPLDAWAAKLAELRGDEGQPLERHALRMILLTAIGALQGRGFRTTHEVTAFDAAAELAELEPVNVEPAGDVLVYELEGAAAMPNMAHPEWSAAIWARQRARLLDGPGPSGALRVPAETVLALRTDALYLTRDPRWPDDGAAGRFRVVDQWRNVELPRNTRELLEMKAGR